MALYALSDLHLSFGSDKPMNVFGSVWHNYESKIKENWESTIRDNDLVIIGGDFSWATYLEEAKTDFAFIESLPGKKLILKGNHDYWWESVSKMNRFCRENGFNSVSFLHNDAVKYDNFLIGGTRLWITPESDTFKECDRKIYEREKIRAKISFDNFKKYDNPDLIKVAVFHYPPFLPNGKCDYDISEILLNYNIKKCIYGHLHSQSAKSSFNGILQNIEFRLTSADYLDFTPMLISEN